MVDLVRLKFECLVECSSEYADDLGSDIATDLLCEWDNGVDYLEWLYCGHELQVYGCEKLYMRIHELENELDTYKTANKVLKKSLEDKI